jgi:hypothetical protein
MLLSRRRLVFTSTQMYFQCASDFELESFQAKEHPVSLWKSDYMAFPTGVVGDGRSAILKRLCEYYIRQLSFSEDIIDAFIGIINAFDRPQIVGGDPVGHVTATHFYGIPIIRPEYSPGIAQYTFIRGLGYVILSKGTPFSPQTDPTCMFPSWTWASIKATEASASVSEMYYYHSCEKDLINFQEQDVNVMLWDRHKGAVSLSSFANTVDVYTELQPWLDFATWARSYTVTQHETVDSFWRLKVQFDRNMAVHVLEDMAKFGMFLLCLSTRAPLWLRDGDLYVDARGLLVVGTGKETYRRVGAWHCRVKLETTNIPKEIQELVVLACASSLPSRTWRGRPLKSDRWRGTRRLAAAGWEQRTMRLV